MRILLLTKLFPTALDRKKENVTHALYDFAKYWQKNHEILVIRPFFLNIQKKYKFKKYSEIRREIKTIDLKLLNFKNPTSIIKNLEAEKFTPDVVVSHMSYAVILGRELARTLEIPFVMGFHETDYVLTTNKHILSYFLKNEIVKSMEAADVIAFRSDSLKRRTLKEHPKIARKSILANSGIPGDLMVSSEVYIGKIKTWKKYQKINFVTACNLIGLKNVGANLHALSRFNRLDWSYTIIGEGPKKKKLQKLAYQLGIKNKVRFLGHVERKEVIRQLDQGHIFLMISAPETFGIAYLEAMARGCLVVGAANFGIDGVVKHGVNGFLCDPGDIHGLLTTLNEISDMTEERLSSISHECFETVQKLEEKKAAESYLREIENVWHGSL